MAALNFKARKNAMDRCEGKNIWYTTEAKWPGMAITANGIRLAESWTPDSQYNHFIR